MYEHESVEIHGTTVEKGELYEVPSEYLKDTSLAGIEVEVQGYQDDVGDDIYYVSVDTDVFGVQLRGFSTDTPEVALRRLLRWYRR